MMGWRIHVPPKANNHRPASETPFRWRADNGPTLNAGLVVLRFFRGSGPVLLENTIFYDFSGGAVPDPLSPPSGSANAFDCLINSHNLHTGASKHSTVN